MRECIMSNVCTHCNYENIIGALVCENCGNMLVEAAAEEVSTRQLEEQDSDQSALSIEHGTKTFTSDAKLMVDLGGEKRTLPIGMDDEITFGRVDRFTSLLPTINLTNHRAWERGVSRLHASISRVGDSLYITDLNSTNGTYLNGKRLPPEDSHLIHDGDQIRLGLFDLTIYFVREKIIDTVDTTNTN